MIFRLAALLTTGSLSMNDDDFDSEQQEHIRRALEGKETVYLEEFSGPLEVKRDSDPPTVQFSPVIAPNLGIPKETQRSLERMRAMIRNGAIALCLVGCLYVVQAGVGIWQGRSQRAKDDATTKAINESSAAITSLAEQMKSQQEMQMIIVREQQENQRMLIKELQRRNIGLTEK
jgi:hypothetical protein